MAGRSGAAAALPVAAICCLGLLLFGIAATVVLALIPIYTPAKDVTPSSNFPISTSQSFSVPIDGSGLTGSLSESERSQVGTQLQGALSSSSTSDGSVSVSDASVQASGGRKRQSSFIFFFVVLIRGRNRGAVNRIARLIREYIRLYQSILAAFVLALLRRRTTTVAPIASTSVSTAVSAASTTASGRRRRQLNEGDASTPPLVTYRD